MHVAKQSAQGSIVLFTGNLTATAGQTVASIVIARLLGPQDYGGYTLALVIPGILLLFVSLSANVAVTRFVAHHVSMNEMDEAKRFTESAVLITLLTGVALSAVCYFAAGPLCATLFHRAYLKEYVEIASAFVAAQGVLNTAVAAAIGWNAMGRSTLSGIVGAATKMVVSPLLIVVGLGVAGAMAGQTLAAVVAAAVSVGVLYGTRMTLSRMTWRQFMSDLRQMMNYGLPAFTAGIFGGIWPYFLSTVLAAVATDTVIGYYQSASNFTIAITLLSGAAGSALFPAFTSLHGRQADMSTALRLAVKYVAYVTVPCVFLLAAASRQLLVLFYGQTYLAGSTYLVLLSLSAIPVLIGLTVLPSFFNGIAQTRLTLVMVGLGAVVLFIGAPMLAIALGEGVNGVIYALFLSNLTASLVGLYLFRAKFSAGIDVRSAAATLVAGAVGFGLCYAVPPLSSNLLALVAKLVLFLLVYLTLAPLLRAVSGDDLEILRESLGEMPVLRVPIRLLLSYEKMLVPRKKTPQVAEG